MVREVGAWVERRHACVFRRTRQNRKKRDFATVGADQVKEYEEVVKALKEAETALSSCRAKQYSERYAITTSALLLSLSA